MKVLRRLAEIDRNQAWLARQLGKEQYVVHRWLNGSRFTDADRRLVAAVLGRPVDWLIERPEPAVERAA